MLARLERLSPMWDGYLGSITVAKHHIEINAPEVFPIHSAPYRMGPGAREFEKEEFEKMSKIGVIEPA